MAYSVREMHVLQDALVTLSNVSAGTVRTLITLSKGQFQDTTTTQTLENQIALLKASIEATNTLILDYERKVREGKKKKALQKHMEDAKILTDSLRAIRHGDSKQPPQRRNTNHGMSSQSKFQLDSSKSPAKDVRDPQSDNMDGATSAEIWRHLREQAEGDESIASLISAALASENKESTTRYSQLHSASRLGERSSAANGNVAPGDDSNSAQVDARAGRSHLPKFSRLTRSISTPLRRGPSSSKALATIVEISSAQGIGNTAFSMKKESGRSVSDGNGQGARKS
jgi:hypothetical protein